MKTINICPPGATPGPWTLSDSGFGLWSTNRPLHQNGVIGIIRACARPESENLANARLAVQAPAMYQALHRAAKVFRDYIDEDHPVAREIDAVLGCIEGAEPADEGAELPLYGGM